MTAAARPARPQGHGAAWDALEGEHAQIVDWVGLELTVFKIGDLLHRRGLRVPHRMLHRYCVDRTDYRSRSARETVPVVDGEPGVECQIDFARMGLIYDSESGRRRVVHALIFTAVFSRHMFVWLTFAQTLEAIVASCEAAWVRSSQDKPRVERVVQYVRGNFFAGEEFIDLTDAQGRAEIWCADTAGQRIHATI
ncbi:hypothetical protein [Mycobacterium gastri]|uniref:hypothetical protein n=1 Tax=Mycobacterium gastri TaxID=1777 RepID=UPI001FC983BC|nr:hypothetical protein [Mycobacterium gastri]